eukprot:20157-Heterococcus_DN1.PRE.1
MSFAIAAANALIACEALPTHCIYKEYSEHKLTPFMLLLLTAFSSMYMYTNCNSSHALHCVLCVMTAAHAPVSLYVLENARHSACSWRMR